MQASLPIPALWSETEAVPMPLPVPPKTDVADEHSDDWLRCSSLLRNLPFNTPAEVRATQIADSTTADLFSMSSDLAGSRPRCTSFICADSSTGEVEQGEPERADQASRAGGDRLTADLPPRSPCLPHGMSLRALPSHSLLSHLAPFPA